MNNFMYYAEDLEHALAAYLLTKSELTVEEYCSERDLAAKVIGNFMEWLYVQRSD